MPEMTDELVIQEVCPMWGDDFVVASNTMDTEHTSFSSSQQAHDRFGKADEIPCGHGICVTATETIMPLA
jgi:hypothetical protein